MLRSPVALATNIVQMPNAAPSQLMSDFQWFGDTLRSQNRSPHTIESYRLTLDTFDRYLESQGLARQGKPAAYHRCE